MNSVSSGKTRGSYPHHRRKKKNKKKKYVKFPKRLKNQKKTVSEQSQNELEPIIALCLTSNEKTISIRVSGFVVVQY